MDGAKYPQQELQSISKPACTFIVRASLATDGIQVAAQRRNGVVLTPRNRSNPFEIQVFCRFFLALVLKSFYRQFPRCELLIVSSSTRCDCAGGV
ncbi:MAG TPA: hypothetical protein VGL59_06970 [Polyangia bacterium]|jgi:hypothetical protein